MEWWSQILFSTAVTQLYLKKQKTGSTLRNPYYTISWAADYLALVNCYEVLDYGKYWNTKAGSSIHKKV